MRSAVIPPLPPVNIARLEIADLNRALEVLRSGNDIQMRSVAGNQQEIRAAIEAIDKRLAFLEARVT